MEENCRARPRLRVRPDSAHGQRGQRKTAKKVEQPSAETVTLGSSLVARYITRERMLVTQMGHWREHGARGWPRAPVKMIGSKPDYALCQCL